jgi:hypothetical protein
LRPAVVPAALAESCFLMLKPRITCRFNEILMHFVSRLINTAAKAGSSLRYYERFNLCRNRRGVFSR